MHIQTYIHTLTPVFNATYLSLYACFCFMLYIYIIIYIGHSNNFFLTNPYNNNIPEEDF